MEVASDTRRFLTSEKFVMESFSYTNFCARGSRDSVM